MDKNSHLKKRRVANETKAFSCRDSIIRLHAEGKTDAEIAAVVGLPVCAITKEREQLGLMVPVTSGQTYTAAEDQEIVRLRDDKGYRWTEIRAKMGSAKTPLQIQLRYNYLDGLRTRRARNGEKTMRECKNPECQRPFMSEGFHHRFCDPCRENVLQDVDYYLVAHATGSGLEAWV
jgi:hypothetical protein